MKRGGQRLLVIAVMLGCVGGMYRAHIYPSVATSDPNLTAASRDPPGAHGVPMPPTAMSTRAATPTSNAEPPCDLTAPEPETTGAQELQDTEAQARYDLTLARHLRATGNPIDQAVGSLLGRIEDWEPRELVDQVSEVAGAAVLTSDDKLYTLALKACARLHDLISTVAAPAACSQLASSRLTLLQPDGAMVWLQAAQAAREHQDTAAELDAMYRASLARQSERPGVDAIRVAGAAMASTDPAWLRYGALRKLSEQIVPSGGWSLVHEGSQLAGSCATDELGDANRRQLCERLAHHLLDTSAGAAGLWTGTAIGLQLGWSTERLNALLRKARPMFEAGRSLTPFPPHDCRASVHLAVLEATLASDAPARLSAPPLKSALDTLTQKRLDEVAREEAPQEANEADAKAKAADDSEPEPSEPSASSTLR